MGFKLDNTVSAKTNSSSTGKSGLTALLEKEITLFGKSFSNKKKEDFYTELSVLLKAGIHLKEALTLIEENQKKEKQQLFYHDLVDGLVSGHNLSEVVQEKSEFTEYEYHSLKIGEETGTIAEVVTELGRFFAGKNEQRRNLVNALTYPIIILITAVVVVTFMLRMVVPMFQDIFRQNKVDLPWITEVIISASDFIGTYGWWIVFSVFLLLVFQKRFTTKKWFKRRKDYLVLRLPYVGKFMKSVYLAQFTQAITLLTSSKLPVLNSIQLVGRMIDFYPLREALSQVEERIKQGKGLSDSLKGNTMFDHRMVSLVKVAEETNQTEFIFDRLNQQYNIEIQQKSKLLSTLMEPLIILIVGILVGVILVAMYLPMFKLGSVLG
ncbi:type II secretion system F family protein [Costertonia aggregata]|uniref:Type II secretion system F family protein n=1 Tax=Costertonia aggregata TaxID=343403 RepID=A0A7H9ATM3_9FLAO|nr:type II secretion system F family protein [Costertonia aggregata]QLG46790.1 type II secretion system F family protein [Costertonia aggregata]